MIVKADSLRSGNRLGRVVIAITAVLFLLLHAVPSQAEELAKYEFTFNTDVATSKQPTSSYSNVTGSIYDFTSDASNIVGWSGVEGNPGAAFYGSTTVVSTEAYMSFELTMDSGYSLTLEEIILDSRRNPNAATTYNIKYSTDGTSFTSIGSGSLTGTTYEIITADNEGTPISDLSGTVYFRIYGSGWSGIADENQYWYHDNVTIYGSITGSTDETPPTTSASLTGGTYASSQSVILICVDGSGSGCDTTYYCLGSECTDYTPYSDDITISATTDLRFFSTDLAGNDETVQTVSYVIQDSDDDGMLDSWETTNFGDLSHDGTADTDNDGLTDLQEFQNSTDPNDSDSDDDGLTDGQEVTAGTDPNDGGCLEYVYRWGDPYTIESGNGSAISPQIATDQNNNAFAVWYQSDGTRNNILANRFDATTQTWGQANTIESGSGHANNPQIAIDQNNNAFAVWNQLDGNYKIFVNRFDATTQAWGEAYTIESGSGQASSPQIAVDQDNNAHVVWSQSDGTRYNIWANRFDTTLQAWGDAYTIESDNAGQATSPQIAVDQDNNAHAVWQQHDGTRYNIWANRFDATTQAWGQAYTIESENAGSAQYPQIAVDQNNNTHAVWQQHDGSRYNIWVNRFDATTQAWGQAYTIEADNAGSAYEPQIAFDNNNNAFAVWRQYDGTRTNIWANRFDATTQAWGVAYTIESDNAGSAELPQIAFDQNNNAHAVWCQHDGIRYNIWVNRYEVCTDDTDNDSMFDSWEIVHFGDLTHDGTVDTDGDGMTDLVEYQRGTDPTISWPLGDIDNDANITAQDVLSAANYSIGLSSLTPDELLIGDFSNNGAVTAYDASLIFREFLGSGSEVETCSADVAISDYTGLAGSIVDIPILVSNLGGNIGGANLEVSYDSGVFSSVEGITTGTLTDGGWTLVPNSQTGNYKAALFGANSFSQNGTLVILRFTISSSPSSLTSTILITGTLNDSQLINTTADFTVTGIPTGSITLNPTRSYLIADNTSTTSISSSTITDILGASVPDGTTITVATTSGTIISADQDPGPAGIQVLTSGGNITFTLQSSSTPENATVTATSLYGDASGSTTISFSADSDSDTLPDAWEMANFGNLSLDGSVDSDSDGLTDLQEYQASTDPDDEGCLAEADWGMIQRISSEGAHSNFPHVAFDQNGNAFAVWYQKDGTKYSIWANRYNATSQAWSGAYTIESDNTGHAVYPQVSFDPNGNAIAVWEQSDGTRNNIWANRYDATALSWGTAYTIESDNSGSANKPKLVIDQSGNAIVVWRQYDGTRENTWSNIYHASTDSWGTAQLIESDDAGSGNHPNDTEVAIDSNGNVLAVWYQFDGTRYNIWANRHDATTQSWGTAYTIESDNTDDARYPQVAFDQNGNAIAVWSQYFGTTDMIWVNHYDAATQSWGTAQVIDSAAYCCATTPHVAIDINGNAIVVWQEREYDGSRSIWANRYDATAQAWGTAYTIESDNAGNAYYPQVEFYQNGNALAVWRQYDGTRNNIWANRYDATTNSWENARLLETDNVGEARDQQLAIDQDGNAIAIWSQHDGSFYNIMAINFATCFGDTDKDGMFDSWEVVHFSDLTRDGTADSDSDNLTDLYEYRNNTDPNNTDSDSDGMPDGWEYNYGLNPTLDDSSGDAEGDGLTNLLEYQNNCDPNVSDSDNDGMPDNWEVVNSLDPTSDDTDGDADSDGLTNLQEYLAGTEPDDSNSVIKVELSTATQTVSESAGTVTFTLTLNTASNTAVSVPFMVSGTALGNGVDHDLKDDTITINAGQTVYTKTFTIVDDSLIEPDETVIIILGTPIDAVAGTITTQTVTIPFNDDTDNDNMSDPWEITYFGNLSRDGTGDFDNDGITDLQEFQVGTNPINSVIDTDGDGLTDLQEVTAGTDPIDEGCLTAAWGEVQLIEWDDTNDAFYPQVAADPDGNFIVVWEHNRNNGSNTNIIANRYDFTADAWGNPFTVDSEDSGGSWAYAPQVAADPNGNFIAVWHQWTTGTNNNNIWTNRFDATAESWGTAYSIKSDYTGNAEYPQIAIDPNGNAISVWYIRKSIWANRYDATADSWGTEYTIESNNEGNTNNPRIAFDQSGNAFAVWYQYDGAATNIWANRYDAISESWGTAYTLESGPYSASYPQVAFDQNGNAFAAWQQHDWTRNNIWVNRYDALADSWSIAYTIESDNSGSASKPQIAADQNGNFIAVWAQHDGSRSNIWTNRYDATVGSWSTAYTIESDNSGNAQNPRLTIDPNGNAIAVWEQYDGSRWNIWANRYNAIADAWGTAYTLESNNTGSAFDPQVAVDPKGNFIASWEQLDETGMNSIWANRYDACISDTDTDNLFDTWEIVYFSDLSHNGSADSDSDGLTDQEEHENGTDPTSSDTDGDTMTDAWEVANNLDPTTDDSAGDADSDGLTNLQEFQFNSDPNDADSDDDGLSDLQESQNSTNPNNPDTDSDGMFDGWEVNNSLDPNVDDSGLDTDSDGVTHLQEFQANTNPNIDDTDGDGYKDNFSYGLLAYYPFSGNGNDLSSYNNDAVVNGASFAADRHGTPGSAMSFDGDDDWASIPAASHMDIYENSYTLAFWIKTSDDSGVVFDNREVPEDQGNTFDINITQVGEFTYKNPSGSEQVFYSFQPETGVTGDKWRFIVVTGSTAGLCVTQHGFNQGEYRYINSIHQSSYCSAAPSNFRPSKPIYIGGKSSVLNQVEHYNGLVDDLRVYNRELSENEIRTLFIHGFQAPTGAQITTDSTSDSYPAWNSIGTQIVYSSIAAESNSREIWLMNADGSNKVQLTITGTQNLMPEFSPDDSKIVFSSDRSGNYDIWVMNADGSSPVQLTNDTPSDYRPQFSPDGSQVLFGTTRSGNYDIWVMQADGSNPIQLTSDPALDNMPVWSPDGSKIGFVSSRSGNNDIWIMQADGSNKVQLTSDPSNDQIGSFSFDGFKILFASDREGFVNNLYSMNSDGTNVEQLTSNYAQEHVPAWTQDGSKIALYSDAAGGGNQDVWVYNIAYIDVGATTPTLLDLATEDDTGLSNTDNITNQTTGLSITGYGESGGIVQLYDNGNPAGLTGTVVAGTFSIDIDPAEEGLHSITAILTDLADNVSSPSDPLKLTIDTTPPQSISIGSPADGSSAKPLYSITGTATGAAQVEVQVTDPGNQYLGLNDPLGLGFWTSEYWFIATDTDSWSLTTGTNVWFDNTLYTITAKASDIAGNTTNTQNTFTYKVPDPVIHAITETGGTILPSGNVSVSYGLGQTFTISADMGYEISAVHINGVSQGVITSYTFPSVATDYTITAYFNYIGGNIFTVDASTGTGGGTITPSGAVPVIFGNDQNFVIAPEAGYQIASVTVDGDVVNLQTLLDNTYTFENVIDNMAGGGNHWIQVTFSLIHPSAPTTLSFDLSSSTILLGGTVDLSGKLTRLPDLGIDLSGIPITLEITAPDNNVYTQATTTDNGLGHLQIAGLTGFNQKGLYSFEASFAGTGSLFTSTSDLKTLLVGSQAGYAVVIQGRLPGAIDLNVSPPTPEGIKSHRKTASRIYNKLKSRSFVDDNIWFFGDDDTQPGGAVLPTKTDIGAVFTSTAPGSLVDRMNNSPAPLYVIMVDHGNRDKFYIGDEYITPTDMQGWLNTLEGNLTGNAPNEKRVVIIGACFSGTFINPLSANGRIIITSAAGDEESFKGPDEPDGVRSGEFFLEEFFKQLERGESLKDAFEVATENTEKFTRRGGGSSNSNNAYFDNSMQHPLLDDNGDGLGSNELSDDHGDGMQAAELFLGAGVSYDTNSADNPADIDQVTETLFLDEYTSIARLWAITNDDTQVLNAWIEVRSPSVELSSDGGTEQLEVNLDRHFMALNDALSPAQWKKIYSSFTASGKYEIFYFVRDSGDTSLISPMKWSVVYKNRPNNSLPAERPSAFNLVYPPDTAVEKTVLLFDWEDSTDVDELTYTLMIASDAGFNTVVHMKEDIDISITFIGPSAGLEDQTEYWWKVIAVDSYGARTESPAWSFNTNNTNTFPGVITGIVYSQLDMSAIAGAQVVVTIGADIYTTQSLAGGRFIIPVPAGTAEISSTPDGYQTASIAGVTISEGGETKLNVMTLPLNATEDTTPPTTEASPAGGTYVEEQSVTLTCTDTGGSGCAEIYYTTDGSEPTIGSQVYTTPISINSNTTLKFFAKDQAGMSEAVNVESYVLPIIKGDVNNDRKIDLADAILAMQVMTGAMPAAPQGANGDVNGDGRIGLQELIYILQSVSGLRD